jgi:hypothetical protein
MLLVKYSLNFDINLFIKLLDFGTDLLILVDSLVDLILDAFNELVEILPLPARRHN